MGPSGALLLYGTSKTCEEGGPSSHQRESLNALPSSLTLYASLPTSPAGSSSSTVPFMTSFQKLHASLLEMVRITRVGQPARVNTFAFSSPKWAPEKNSSGSVHTPSIKNEARTSPLVSDIACFDVKARNETWVASPDSRKEHEASTSRSMQTSVACCGGRGRQKLMVSPSACRTCGTHLPSRTFLLPLRGSRIGICLPWL
mmetsp:Transcript_159274/g.297048  ORF Transcript_159274/g.297048 Transcript_159274/m.297048 type:complete len:201 (+) Transcript_159274:1324-1926(+)